MALDFHENQQAEYSTFTNYDDDEQQFVGEDAPGHCVEYRLSATESLVYIFQAVACPE